MLKRMAAALLCVLVFAAALPALAAEESGDGTASAGQALVKCGVKLSLEGLHFIAFAEVAAFIAGLALLTWGAIWLWNRETGRIVRFDLPIALVLVTGILIVVLGEIIVPVFTKGSIYKAFGANLPAPTMILRDFHHLLLVPLVMSAFVMLKLADHPYRARYFSALAVLEYALLCLALWAFYIPAILAC